MKKKLVKILCVLIVISLLFGSTVTAFAFLFIDNEETEVKTLQNGDLELPEATPLFYKSGAFTSYASDADASEFIYNSLLNCESSFRLYSYKVNKDYFGDLYAKVINDHPDLFYVSSSVAYNFVTTSGYIYDVRPEYTMTSSEIATARIIFDNGVEKALSQVDNSMTDIQKCLVIHDYLCDITTYPVFNDGEESQPIHHSAYGIFYNGNAVCAGYALSYSYLLHMLGIECEYVTSVPMVHAWNAVKIDNNWYNVDVTYDDFSHYSDNSTTRGAMLHRCFMKSDQALSGDMGLYHFGGTTYDNYTLTDTTYDDYFWNNVTTNIIVKDGVYYYLDGSTRQYLNSYTTDDVQTRLSTFYFSAPYIIATHTTTDADGNSHNIDLYLYTSRLVYLDNRFYVGCYHSIYSCYLTDNTYVRYTVKNDIEDILIGLAVENNELVYQDTLDNQEIRLDKLDYFRNNISTTDSSVYNNYPDINIDGYVNAKDYKMITEQ